MQDCHGEVSKWVALLTLTLVGVMDYRGMPRRTQKNGRARNRQRPLAAIVSVRACVP